MVRQTIAVISDRPAAVGDRALPHDCLPSNLLAAAASPKLPLTLPEDEVRTFGEHADLVAGAHLAGGHQAIERVLKLARQGVLEVGSSVFRITPVMEKQRFGAGSEFHLKGCGRMLEENLAGPGEFEVQDSLQVRGSKWLVNNRFLDAAQKFRREVALEGTQ